VLGLVFSTHKEKTISLAFWILPGRAFQQPANAESGSGPELLTNATRIAEASGGFLGLGSISATERALIERVVREIENAHSEAARDIAQRL